MGGNLKRKLQDIVLGREEKTEWWSTWECKLLNMAECHVIGQINNEEFLGSGHMRLHVQITGHTTKLKQELLIN